MQTISANMKNFLIRILLILCIPFASFAQNSRTGLNYGVQIGWQWLGNEEAKLYNCGPESDVNLNTVLNYDNNRTKLEEYYNDGFTLYELPQNVKYKSTLSIGGTLQYYTTETFAIFLNAYYVSPTITNSSFSIKLDSQNGNLSNEVIKQGTITAKESRFNFELGIHKTLPSSANYIPFFEFALAGSYLEMKEHDISIGNVTQSILYYSRTDANTEFSKFGYGASCAAGIQLPLSDKLYLYAGISASAVHYGIFDNAMSIAKSIDLKVLL